MMYNFINLNLNDNMLIIMLINHVISNGYINNLIPLVSLHADTNNLNNIKKYFIYLTSQRVTNTKS